jgi:putative ATP-dependent endonuclease of OLD family
LRKGRPPGCPEAAAKNSGTGVGCETVLLERIDIKGFRGIRQMSLKLEAGTTVLIGENNTGKSSILEAIRRCLASSTLPGRDAFLEYDYHMADRNGRPADGDPIEIVLYFALQPSETDAMGRMEKALQTDGTGTSVILCVRSTYDDANPGATTWEFLNLDGERLTIDPQYHRNALRKLVIVFYLNALRDAAQEFKPTAKFWRPFVRSLNMDAARKSELETALNTLNKQVIDAHASFGAIRERLGKITEMIPLHNQDPVSIQAIPDKMFDVLSRAQVMLTSATGADIPLGRHGEGTQSLAVVCLFGAFLSSKLAETYTGYASPILAIEEPEAHLHPSAARATADILRDMGGQKIITTHSGDVVSGAPIGSMRRLHRKNGAISVNQVNETMFDDEEMRKIKYHVLATRGNLFFARCWLLVEGESDRIIFERCAMARGYDIMRHGIHCIEYSQSNLSTLLKLANQLGIGWLVVADGDSEGDKNVNYAQEYLEGRDEGGHICRLAHGDLELFLCMEGYGSFYEDNISPIRRPKPSGDVKSLDYWKDVLDRQSKRKSRKTHTAEKITEQIKSEKDVPAPIRDILNRLARIAEDL